jgi:hypothetical protein
MSPKISIRFFDDREVRAIWDDANHKWWFSVLDIIGVLNGEDDYQKNRNYWKYLKTKLRKESSEVVSVTNQLKILAPDGKYRLSDVLDNNGVIAMVRSSVDSTSIHNLLHGALTDKINDRETFMKGIDYSYYYEQED